MRIISGKYKGRLIKMPKGIRPTQNKVRKALFDILGDIKGLSFLELFAGSGAVGIEALSKGAKEVVFVEEDRRCVEQIKENLKLIGLLSYPVMALDIAKALKNLAEKKKNFDIVFLYRTFCYNALFNARKARVKKEHKKNLVSPLGSGGCSDKNFS